MRMPEGSLVEVRSLLGAGGGRGLFAIADIGPGTLLLHEQPLVTVPADKAPQVHGHAHRPTRRLGQPTILICICVAGDLAPCPSPVSVAKQPTPAMHSQHPAPDVSCEHDGAKRQSLNSCAV